jgi:hypothetical protein
MRLWKSTPRPMGAGSLCGCPSLTDSSITTLPGCVFYERSPGGACSAAVRRRCWGLSGHLALLQTRGVPFMEEGRYGAPPVFSARTPVAVPSPSRVRLIAALLHAAVRRAHEQSTTRLQLKTFSNQLDGGGERSRGRTLEAIYTLTLPDHPDHLRFGDARSHARIKWAVNKAQSWGLRCGLRRRRTNFGLVLALSKDHAAARYPTALLPLF